MVLKLRGYQLRSLTRSKSLQGEQVFYWEPLSGYLDPKALKGVDSVVHLAGASISKRWTPKVREAITQSRILGTRTLVEAMEANACRADLISSSGINFYGCDVGYLEGCSGEWARLFVRGLPKMGDGS